MGEGEVALIVAFISFVGSIIGTWIAGIYAKRYDRKCVAYEAFIKSFANSMPCVGFRVDPYDAMNKASTEYEIQEKAIRLYASYELSHFLDSLRITNNIPFDRPIFLQSSLDGKWNNTTDEYRKQIRGYFSNDSYTRLIQICKTDLKQ